jgi:hypothetical protein
MAHTRNLASWTVLVGLAGALGCSSTESNNPQPTKCISNADCNIGGVCVNGTCQSSTGAGGASSGDVCDQYCQALDTCGKCAGPQDTCLSVTDCGAYCRSKGAQTVAQCVVDLRGSCNDTLLKACVSSGAGGATGSGGTSSTGGTATGGTSPGDICDQGCSRLQGCGLCIRSAGVCLSPADCASGCRTNGEQPAAQCIVNLGTSCDQTALNNCLNNGTGGTTGSGGTTSTGGTVTASGGTPTGGTATGGVLTASGGTPTGGTGTSGTSTTAKVKFCHNLTSSGANVTLTLNVNGTTVSALTGNCAPAGSCATFPAAASVPISLLNGSTVLWSGTANNLTAGTEYLYRGRLDSTDSSVTVSGGRADGICSGGGGITGTVAKFCNHLSKSSGSFTATLNIGSSSFSAATGTCVPIGTCTAIPSGTNVAISLMDGTTSVLSGTYPTITAGNAMVFFAEMDDAGTNPTIRGSVFNGICSVSSGSLLPRGYSPVGGWSDPSQAEVNIDELPGAFMGYQAALDLPE